MFKEPEQVFVSVSGKRVPIEDPEVRGLGGGDVELSFTAGNQFYRYQHIGDTWEDSRQHKAVDSNSASILRKIEEFAKPVVVSV